MRSQRHGSIGDNSEGVFVNQEATMSLPIVQLILIRGYTEAYYQFSDEEQEKL